MNLVDYSVETSTVENSVRFCKLKAVSTIYCKTLIKYLSTQTLVQLGTKNYSNHRRIFKIDSQK